MNNIEIIKSIDSEVFDVIKEPFAEITSNISKYPIKDTIRTFVFFSTRIEFIKNAIFTLYDVEDLYSSKILFRSLIEHFLRFQYLFFRYFEVKNDEPIIEYNLFSDLAEDIEYGKALRLVQEIRGDINSNPDIYELLQKIKPEFNKYSKEEIKDNASKYRYRNIIRYIEEKLSSTKNKDNNKKNNFILNLIPEYSELSSFVHGGPFAEQYIVSHRNEDDRMNELFHIAELALFISISVKEFFFITVIQHDKIYEDTYKLIRNIRAVNAI